LFFFITDAAASAAFSFVGGSPKKEAPLSRGLLVACLLVCGGVFSLFLLLSECGLHDAAWTKKEQALCQRNLTRISRSKAPTGASIGGKLDFGQYVTSEVIGLLSKSSTQGLGLRAT
jgi:hypothetical protein